MRTALAAAAALLFVLMAPGAAAQDAPTGVLITLDDPVAPIAPGGTGAQGYTVLVGCVSVLTAQGTTVTMTAEGPAWLGANTTDLEVDPAACLTGAGFVNLTGSIAYAVAADAPGMTPGSVEVTATLGTDTNSATTAASAAYRPGYTISTDADFPLPVTGGEAKFNVTIAIDANADTMVMFNTGDFTPLGSIAVPTFLNFRDMSGPTEQVIPITYTAPISDWETDSFEFTTWSHYLNDGTMKTNDQVVTWSFENAGGSAGGNGGSGDGGKDSPGPAVVLSVLALLGIAAVAGRRRDA